MSKKSTGNIHNFNDDEIEILRKLCKAYSSKKVRASKEYKEMFEAHGKKAIVKKLAELDLRTPYSDWTPEEDEIILMDGRAISRSTVKKYLPHRTFSSVMARLKLLGCGADGKLSPPQGYIFLREACDITGLDYVSIRSVAEKYDVRIRIYMGVKGSPKKSLYYVDEEDIREAAKKHFDFISNSTTVSDIIKEFGGISMSIVKRAMRISGISVDFRQGATAHLTNEQAEAIRKTTKEILDKRTGYITIDDAISKYNVSREFVEDQIAKNNRICRKMFGKVYVGEISLKRAISLSNKGEKITIKDIVEELGSTHRIVSYAHKKLFGVVPGGKQGRKLLLSKDEAEKLRSFVAHKKVMLDSWRGQEVDA